MPKLRKLAGPHLCSRFFFGGADYVVVQTLLLCVLLRNNVVHGVCRSHSAGFHAVEVKRGSERNLVRLSGITLVSDTAEQIRRHIQKAFRPKMDLFG
jgi:hypothetical protein